MSRRKREGEANDQKRSFADDSLEENDFSAKVAPEKSGNVDYKAFSSGSDSELEELEEVLEEEELYLGLVPMQVLNQLQDDASPNNRIDGIQQFLLALDGATESQLKLEATVTNIVAMVMEQLNQTHAEVIQLGLELVNKLVEKIGKRILTYLNIVVPSLILKIATNRHIANKQTGTRVMVNLLRNVLPQQVVSLIASFGVPHRSSRIREESINLLMVALLTCRGGGGINLLALVPVLCPCLVDPKQKVRQATLEAFALVAGLVAEGDLHQVVSAVASLERKMPSMTAGVMSAFQSRLSREKLPHLNSYGLVEHVVSVADMRGPFSVKGADVNWILAAVESSNGRLAGRKPEGREEKPVVTLRKTSVATPRSFHSSASRRLPWVQDMEDLSKVCLSSNTQVRYICTYVCVCVACICISLLGRG